MPTLRFCPIWLCSLGLVALLQGCSVWGSRTETDTPRRQQLRRELRLKRLLSRFEVLPERWQLVVSDSSFRRDISGRFYCGDRQLMPVDNRLISPCLNLEGLRNSRGIIPTQFYALGQVPVRAGPKPLLMVAPLPTGYVLVWAQAEPTEHPPSLQALAVLDPLHNPTVRGAELQVPASGLLQCTLLPTDTSAQAHSRWYVSVPEPTEGLLEWRMAER